MFFKHLRSQYLVHVHPRQRCTGMQLLLPMLGVERHCSELMFEGLWCGEITNLDEGTPF